MSMTCPVCDSADIRVSSADVPASDIGLPGGILRGVPEIECAECGETSIELPAQGFVLREYRNQLARVARDLTSEEFAFLRRSLRLTGRGYAELLGVSNVTISRIEHGQNIPGVQDTLVRALTLFDLHTGNAVSELAGRDAAEVIVDVAQIARDHPAPVAPTPVLRPVAATLRAIHDVTAGWRELATEPLRGRVVRQGTSRPARTVLFEPVEQAVPMRMAAGCH